MSIVLDAQEPSYPFEGLVVRLNAAGPMELEALGESFIALAQSFDRHVAEHFPEEPRPQVKLFVTEISQGSIIATIAPFLMLLSEPVAWMSAVNTVKSFSGTFIEVLKKFSGDVKTSTPASIEDAKTLEAFLKPLTGRKAADLNVSHARFKYKNGPTEMLAEYKMGASELNLAAANASKQIEAYEARNAPSVRHVPLSEVSLRLHQVSEAPGKEKGRTGDRAIVPEVSDRDLPLYFPKQSNEYKAQILERTENPFQKHYIVDVTVEYEGETPRLYRLTHLHQVVDP